MKKLFTFMIAALFASVQAMAQTAFATLVHGETLSSFTGADALSQAMNAAADGDIITLSAGTFNGCTIKQAITLRGAGMEADELGRQTVINGNVYISIRGGKIKTVSIEGIAMQKHSLIVSDTIETVYLNKCGINTYDAENRSTKIAKKSYITNCKINKIDFNTTSQGWINPTPKRLYAYNSYIGNGGLYRGESRYDNCVFETYDYGSYYNCIFLKRLGTHEVADHCVASDVLDGGTDSNNYQVEDITTLFNNYDANANWYTRDLTLTDEAKAKYLGSDGTEVGIYGGSLPFSPWLDRPFIKKLTVAPKSTRDGKLSVDIEVGDAE